LISVPIPANSIGDFHSNLINGTSENIKTMFKDNIFQLLNQLQYKENHSFRQFSVTAKTIKSQIENANDFAELKRLEELVQRGIKFYHRAHRPILASLVVFGVISWMLFTVILILSSTSIRFQISSRNNMPKVFIITASIISAAIVVLLKLKSHHIIWFMFAIIPFSLVLPYLQKLPRFIRSNPKSSLLLTVEMFIFSQFLVAVFFYRQVLSVIIIFLAFKRRNNKPQMASLIFLSIFPLLPTISDTENRLLVLGSELCGILLYQTNYSSDLKSDRMVNINLWCSLLIKTMMVLSSAFNQEPSSIVIYFSWFCFIISFITAFYESQVIEKRFISLAFSLFSLYTLFSTYFENLFFLVFIFNILFFIKSETRDEKMKTVSFDSKTIFEDSGKMNKDDIRRVTVFLVYILTSFFGVGNIASLNSFNPSSIESFVFIFNPFLMGILLFIKVLLPFLPTCAGLLAVIRLENLCFSSMMKVIILLSDMMSLSFFFLVKEEGSWLDVGLSISNFSIVLLMNISITLIMALANYLTTKSFTANQKLQ